MNQNYKLQKKNYNIIFFNLLKNIYICHLINTFF